MVEKKYLKCKRLQSEYLKRLLAAAVTLAAKVSS